MKENFMKWKNSILVKQIAGFLVIICFLLFSSTMLQMSTMKFAVDTTYEKMEENASYFVDSLENEMLYVHQLQLDFFNDRRLPFLESENTGLTDYERRDYLLSLQERIQTIAGVSTLVENCILYLPETNYRIDCSKIGRIQEEDWSTLLDYLNAGTGKMQFDQNHFWLTQTSGGRRKEDGMERIILVVTFSTDAIEKRLCELSNEADTGAFFYYEKYNQFFSKKEQTIEPKLYQKLQRDEEGNFIQVQRIKIDDASYLVCVKDAGSLGIFVQYTAEYPIMKNVILLRGRMYSIIIVMIVMAALFTFYMKHYIHRPIQILMKAFDETKSSGFNSRIHHEGVDEFTQLYDGFNQMQERMGKLVEEVYVQKALVQSAQLKQLQAQINPHFLYNSFFILSRRIKREDYENAQVLAQHLGEYFQFLTRNESDSIPLKKEVDHAQCYTKIQTTRFAGRIRAEFEKLPEKAAGILVPRLILQPLLENVFGHGLYNKMEDGIVQVSYEQKNEKIVVAIEDNGEELTDEILAGLQQRLMAEDDGEITGMVNIHKRLQYYFKGKGGLVLSRSKLGGLKVEVVIPFCEEDVDNGERQMSGPIDQQIR